MKITQIFLHEHEYKNMIEWDKVYVKQAVFQLKTFLIYYHQLNCIQI